MRLITTYIPISAIKKLTLFLADNGCFRTTRRRNLETRSAMRRESFVRTDRWSNRRSAEIRSDWPFLRSRWTIGIVRLKYLRPRIDDVDRNCVNTSGCSFKFGSPNGEPHLPLTSLALVLYLEPLSMYIYHFFNYKLPPWAPVGHVGFFVRGNIFCDLRRLPLCPSSRF